MIKGRQKQKGTTYELSIAKLFTEVYYPEGDGEFRRVPLSGGWDKRLMPGDLVSLRYMDESRKDMAIDETFPFSIECKNCRGVKQFFSGLYSGECAFFEWIKQAWEDASAVKKTPMVVFKLFRVESVVELISFDFNQLTDTFGSFKGKIYTIEKRTVSDGQTTYQKLIFALLKDFLEWIDWDVFKMKGKNEQKTKG